MSYVRTLQQRKVELSGLRQLLASSTDDVLEKPMLRSKIDAREREIAQLEQNPPIEPETELLFGGGGTFGAIGIEAKLAGNLLDAYQDMVSNHHGGRLKSSMSGAGRRPWEQQSKLYLTALPRGSMGIALSQPNVEDFVTAQQIGEVMEQLTGLIEESGATDERFMATLADFHPRVLKPLTRFFDALRERGSSVTVRSGRKQAELDARRVAEAYDRVSTLSAESEAIRLRGVSQGVLVASWRFDFITEDGRLISGRLGEDVTVEQAHEMGRHFDRRCDAEFSVTVWTTRAGTERRNFELLRLTPITGA